MNDSEYQGETRDFDKKMKKLRRKFQRRVKRQKRSRGKK